MTGRLGVELPPKLMPKNEREFAVNAIATYKKIRPIVQFGDLYRLNSPYGSDGWASQAFVSPGKNRALLFAYSVKHHSAGIFPRIKLKGLDAKKLTAWLNSTQKKSRWHR